MESDNYNNWIKTNYPTNKSCANQCNIAVRNMVAQFSELTIQVGYANNRYHCWCKNINGQIIDPTAKQFTDEIKYTLIAERFLEKDEIELSTGAIFLNKSG